MFSFIRWGYLEEPTGLKDQGDHFLISPPYIITEEEIDTALDIIDESITEFEKDTL